MAGGIVSADIFATPAELSELRYLLRLAMRRVEHVKVACMGKASFDDPQEASRAIRRPGLCSYRCAHCGKWHVWHNRRPPREPDEMVAA